MWKAAVGRAESEEAGAGGGNPQGATDVCADSEGTAFDSEESGFASGRAAARQVCVQGVDSAEDRSVESGLGKACLRDLPAIAIIHRLGNHHRSRHVRLDKDYRAQLFQQSDNRTILLHRLQSPRTEPNGARFTLDIEIVFDRDRKPVKRSQGLPMGSEIVVQFSRTLKSRIEERDR